MLAPSGDLLRAGIGLKLNQIKRATRSYLRDRTNQATGTVTSYAIAAGMFAAAAIFLLAACLVGAAALFRWIEIKYGLFQAFGAVGALLLVIAAACAAVAASKLKPRTPHFPSLSSRLRVALKANPIGSGQIETAKDTARDNAAAAPRRALGTVTGGLKTMATTEPRRSPRRADPDGDIDRLGSRQTAAAGATIGALMSGRRSERTDNLLLIAATAILALAAQRYFRSVAAQTDSSVSGAASGTAVQKNTSSPNQH